MRHHTSYIHSSLYIIIHIQHVCASSRTFTHQHPPPHTIMCKRASYIITLIHTSSTHSDIIIHPELRINVSSHSFVHPHTFITFMQHHTLIPRHARSSCMTILVHTASHTLIIRIHSSITIPIHTSYVIGYVRGSQHMFMRYSPIHDNTHSHTSHPFITHFMHTHTTYTFIS